MKTKISICISLIGLLVIITTGCVTQREIQMETWAPGTVVVENRSPYRLEIYKNKIPWYDAEGGDSSGRQWSQYHPKAVVLPDQTMVFESHIKRFSLDVEATVALPNLRYARVGYCSKTIRTQHRATVVTIRKSDF